MPGPTETEFFDRAEMLDTKVGADEKDDPAKVARDGWDALMDGKAHIVSGWQNKLPAAAAHVTPAGVLAERPRTMAAPGPAQEGEMRETAVEGNGVEGRFNRGGWRRMQKK